MRLGPRPLSSHVDSSSRVTSSSCVASPSRVTSSSRVASSLRVASPSRVGSHVACLRVSLSSRAVNGWWCWVFAASRGAGPPVAIRGWWCGHVVVSGSGGEALSSSSMGWPLTIPQHPCQCWARLLSDGRPGAANEVSEVGGDDDGVVTHIPQRPRHVRGVGAPLVCYRARTVVLGLQTRLVRWGVMTTGGRSPSPAPSHVRGMGAPPVRCRACTCVCCIEGRADGGCR